MEGQPLPQTIRQRQHRIRGRHDHTAQGHHASRQAGTPERSVPAPEAAPVGWPGDSSACHQHALAALETKVDRFQVADHYQNSRQIRPQIRGDQRICRQVGKQPPADADTAATPLSTSPGRRQCSSFCRRSAAHYWSCPQPRFRDGAHRRDTDTLLTRMPVSTLPSR